MLSSDDASCAHARPFTDKTTSHPALIPHEIAGSARLDPLVPVAQGSKSPALASNPRPLPLTSEVP